MQNEMWLNFLFNNINNLSTLSNAEFHNNSDSSEMIIWFIIIFVMKKCKIN